MVDYSCNVIYLHLTDLTLSKSPLLCCKLTTRKISGIKVRKQNFLDYSGITVKLTTVYLAILALSTTVTVLSWLTQARRLPEAENDTEWTHPPPPDTIHREIMSSYSAYMIITSKWAAK